MKKLLILRVVSYTHASTLKYVEYFRGATVANVDIKKVAVSMEVEKKKVGGLRGDHTMTVVRMERHGASLIAMEPSDALAEAPSVK
jgi:hypothetical protein